MTLRSLKKHRITARTFNRATRFSLLLTLVASGPIAVGQRSAVGQHRTAQPSFGATSSPTLRAGQPIGQLAAAPGAQATPVLRPVPRRGFERNTAATAPSQSDWRLQWRRSTQFASGENPQPSGGRSLPSGGRSLPSGGGISQRSHYASPNASQPSGQPVPSSSEPTLGAGHASKPTPVQRPNFFRDPFGEATELQHNSPVAAANESARADQTVQGSPLAKVADAGHAARAENTIQTATYQSTHATNMVPARDQGVMQVSAVSPVLPVERRPQNTLRRSLASQHTGLRPGQTHHAGALPSREDTLPSPGDTTLLTVQQDDPGLTLPPPSADNLAPLPSEASSESFTPPPITRRTPAELIETPPAEPMDAKPSLRDMLRDNAPEEDAVQGQGDREPMASPDDAVPQQPSDGNEADVFDNPFQRQDRRSDAIDRDQLNSQAEIRGLQDTYSTDDEELLRPSTGVSCNDFRQRLAEQTIDQVSLDISPPYRPDEFDIERYEKLKAEFDERQTIRQWRGIDGRPLAKGQLRDLAYEKAVIETEYGTREALPIDQLSEADLAYIADNWGLPQECLLEQKAFAPRQWTGTTMTWKASNLCHTPLYFQDVNLERYGHTHGPFLEPVVQTAHFFGNVLILPYKMGIHPPNECQYPLGYYRPGNCAPWLTPAVPISARGAINQAATMTGLFWLIP